MAPSLPGSSGRRTATRNSSSSSTATMKREGSFKRDARSSRTSAKIQQDSDSEDVGDSSASGSKRPTRKAVAATRPRGRPPKQRIEVEDDEDEEIGDEDVEDEEDSAEEEKDEKDEKDEDSADQEDIEGEIDEAGEAKITKDGELLGGRQYKCRSFKLPSRGDRIYMLSMDPARVLGFRDSYLFFLRNPQLKRVITTVEERTWMIENGMLMANFKSKLIAVVTARSIFKSFGARIVKGGRSRVDDYYESNAADISVDESDGDITSRAGDDNNSTSRGSAGGANGAGEGVSGPGLGSGSLSAAAKRKLMHDDSGRQITDLNWQYESAMAVRALNARLKEMRKENPKFLDPHTNIEQVPTLLQPSRCDVEATVSEASGSRLSQQPSTPAAGSEYQHQPPATPAPAPVLTVVSIPRSIGPQADTAVKIDIRAGAPPPPLIHDPSVWAAIPEDIRRAIEEAENAAMMGTASAVEDDENDDATKYPISILSGQYQATYPIHQSRFSQPYRIVLPQSMAPHAQFIHHLWSTQARQETGAGPGSDRTSSSRGGGGGKSSRDQSPAQHRTQQQAPTQAPGQMQTQMQMQAPPHQPIHTPLQQQQTQQQQHRQQHQQQPPPQQQFQHQHSQQYQQIHQQQQPGPHHHPHAIPAPHPQQYQQQQQQYIRRR